MTVNNSISSQYWTSQFAKTEPTEKVEFTTRVIAAEQATASTIQAQQISAIPQRLAQKINDLSQTMFNNIGAYQIVWYSSATNTTDMNVSYMIGDYEYSISKADKELQFSKELEASGQIIKNIRTTGNYQGNGFLYSANDISDKSRFYTSREDERENARFRPFVTNVAGANPYAYNGENATFPEALDKKEDQGYTYSDMQNSLTKIESLLDKYLVAAYQNDPDSTETNQLLFLKAKLQSLPEALQKGKQAAMSEIQELAALMNPKNSESILWGVEQDIDSFERFVQYETGMLAEFSMNLAALLPEDQKQELMDALNVILNYTDHKAFELLGTDMEQLKTAQTLKNAIGAYAESLVSRLGAVDNTQTLFELTGDTSIRYNNDNIKESLEKKYNSQAGDSLLQQVLSKKMGEKLPVTESVANA
ncbi:MAG: hypothetical protein K2N12_02500 [Helicobacter sp.]|nr:hypothetical protein [Helicobacter sp.]